MACSERIRQSPIGLISNRAMSLCPVSNAGVGATAAKLPGAHAKSHGKLIGRVMTEAMPNGATPQEFFGNRNRRGNSRGVSKM
jgi:hypothetical protein